MLDFRKEITKIKIEGITSDEQDLEKQIKFFFESLLSALKNEKYNLKFVCTTKLVFVNSGKAIHVKASQNHTSDLLCFVNHNSSELCDMIKQKFKSENFEIYNEEKNTFTIYLD